MMQVRLPSVQQMLRRSAEAQTRLRQFGQRLPADGCLSISFPSKEASAMC